MPNYCYGEIKVCGRKENIEEFEKILNADYNYNNMTFSYKPHFFRIFECYTYEIYEDYGLQYIGEFGIECAWSIETCMTEEGYYKDIKTKFNEFYGTTVQEQAKRLNLQIEILSEESGAGFSEHYVIDNYGNTIVDECKDMREYYIGDHDSYKDYIEDYGEDPDLTEEEFNIAKSNGKENIKHGGFEEWDDYSIPKINMCNLIMCKKVSKGENKNE